MAEDEGKGDAAEGTAGAEGSNSDPAVAAGDEEGGIEKETEESNPTPVEGEKGGEEQQTADFDSVAVTMAAALPYADAVAGVKADFTMPQLQELEQQTLIYRYMAASVPVPTHLVFPIWKTITTSSSSSAGPEQYPTLMGLATLCLDFGKTPEPEPGRCRRTDGKKWRCWRNVVPDQKYCERHLHRGRKRPPVQQLEIIDEPEDVPPASINEGNNNNNTSSGSSKKAKKERVSKDTTDTQVAVPATATAVNSS